MTVETKPSIPKTTDYFPVANGVWGLKDIMVNLYMVSNPVNNTWVLIDAGLKTAYPKIKAMAAQLFGADSKPAAILLTHGHFDHVGALKMLENLPEDNSVPYLPDWTYIHTPGHAPGHVSFFRKQHGVLIAGDAFVTTNQQSAISVLFQLKKLCGPPKYFTYDWNQARKSVELLAALQPSRAATGHGKPMQGKELMDALQNLSQNFYREAVPAHGRYIHAPAVATEKGVSYVPPSRITSSKQVTRLAVLSAALVAGFVVYKMVMKKYQRTLTV